MKRFFWPVLVAVIVLSGCQPNEAKLKGTWKAAPLEVKDKGSSVEKLVKGIFDGVSKDSTIEFNGEGQFKANTGPFTHRGTYTWSGNTLVVQFGTKERDNSMKFQFSADGQRLEQVVDFESDPKFVFVKVKD